MCGSVGGGPGLKTPIDDMSPTMIAPTIKTLSAKQINSISLVDLSKQRTL